MTKGGESQPLITGHTSVNAPVSLERQEQELPLVEEPKDERLCSLFRSTALMSKTWIGSATLGLPSVFCEAGLWIAIPVYSFIVLFACFLMVRMVKTFEHTRKVHGTHITSIFALAEQSSKSQRIFIESAVVLFEAGIGVAYGIYCLNVLPIDPMILRGLVVFVVFFILCMPDLKGLAIISLSGTLMLITALLIIFVVAIQKILTDGIAIDIQYFNPQHSFTFLGFAVYALEGAALILPIYNKMEYKSRPSFNTMLVSVVTGFSGFYIVYGIAVNLAFGLVPQIIVQTVTDPFLRNIVSLLTGLPMALTFPLMLQPVFKMITERFTSINTDLKLMPIKAIIVGAIVAIGYLLEDDFNLFIALIGSTAGAYVQFFFPPFIHLSIMGSEISTTQKFVDWASMIFAVCICTITGSHSILAIIDEHT